MKKAFIAIVLIINNISVYGQQKEHKNPLPLATYNENVNLPLTTKERNQIIEAYGESADKLVFNQPHRLKSIKHILRNRVEIRLITDEKNKKPCPKLSEVSFFNNSVTPSKTKTAFNPETFNPLNYNFEFYSRAASIYHVDGTNYYIIIKSQYQ